MEELHRQRRDGPLFHLGAESGHAAGRSRRALVCTMRNNRALISDSAAACSLVQPPYDVRGAPCHELLRAICPALALPVPVGLVRNPEEFGGADKPSFPQVRVKRKK